jgi:hypothetical protein
MGFGSAFGGAIGGGGGGGGTTGGTPGGNAGNGGDGGSGNSGGGSNNGGGGNPLTLSQLIDQLLTTNEYAPESVSATEIAAIGQSLSDNGLNPNNLTSDQYAKLMGLADWLLIYGIETNRLTPAEFTALLTVAGATPGPLTSDQLTDLLTLPDFTYMPRAPASADQFDALLTLVGIANGQVRASELTALLGAVGVTLPRPLNEISIAQLQSLLHDAGIEMTVEELTDMLGTHDVDLGLFGSGCGGVVSPSTPSCG